MQHRYFITGIDTEVGKTITAAVLSISLKAIYWKPIQSGDLDNSDSIIVNTLANGEVTILPEGIQLKHAMSPHASAARENKRIGLSNFSNIELPKGNLIVEGAGGMMVPLNQNELIIDLIALLKLEVILVVKNYLGSINHTLLSIEVCKQYNIPLKGIIFCGTSNPESESVILNYSKVKCLGRIPLLSEVSSTTISELANKLTFDL